MEDSCSAVSKPNLESKRSLVARRFAKRDGSTWSFESFRSVHVGFEILEILRLRPWATPKCQGCVRLRLWNVPLFLLPNFRQRKWSTDFVIVIIFWVLFHTIPRPALFFRGQGCLRGGCRPCRGFDAQSTVPSGPDERRHKRDGQLLAWVRRSCYYIYLGDNAIDSWFLDGLHNSLSHCVR